MQYGFIGAGVIASAIIRGMAHNKAARRDELSVYDIDFEKAAQLAAEIGLNACGSIDALIQSCDVVFLTIKPDKLAGVLEAGREALNAKRPLVVSVVAGKEFSFIRDAAGFDLPAARVMPNTNAAVGESMSIVCFNGFVTDTQKAIVRRCFEAVGKIYESCETHMPALSCMCGCAPAYAYMFIDALAKSAHKAGIDKQAAIRLAAQTVLGSAKMVLESPLHPAVLTDRVCSPGGTTIEGVCELERRAFQAAVVAAVDKAIEKNAKL
jgi:pyrroline-5-carboxylate reductase